MTYPELRGKVAVVTGANNPYGIGAATAKALAAEGVKVFLHSFRAATSVPKDPPEEPGEAFYHYYAAQPAEAVVQAIGEARGTATSWEADLSRPEAADELIEEAQRRFGPVEILVNNAAYSTSDTFIPEAHERLNTTPQLWSSMPIPTLTAESLDRHVAVNSRAVALLMAAFARRHVSRGARWGRIVNISTDGAYVFPSEVSYGASKAMLEALSRSAAAELGRFGITVNIASLGPIQTGWITPELEARCIANTPLGRIGRPEDVADVLVFLASEKARWLTGQTLHIGGGHAM
jgi:3-oxoacyl-[acyl-carrier protein] reductase